MFSGHMHVDNLQNTGRLCREGESYSQKLIRQRVPRLAQWRLKGIQSSSFVFSLQRGCRKISTAKIRLVFLTILLGVITGFFRVFLTNVKILHVGQEKSCN